MLLPMGAEHTDHDKLIRIVNHIEEQAEYGYFKNPVINSATADRINSVYGDNRVSSLIIPKYESVDYADEQKIDGFSYTCDNGEFFSRKLSEAKGNEGQPICKTGHVPHLADTLRSMAAVCDFDVHGELYVSGGTSDDVTRILGCSEDKALARQQYPSDKLNYMVHDIRRFNGRDLTHEPWFVRRAILEYWFEAYMLENPFIHLSQVLGSPIESYHRIVTHGGEGLVLKNTHGLYLPGKKPANNWIKCKKELTSDVVIMGYNDGTGKNQGMFGSIKFGMYVDGKLKEMGNVSSGLTDEMRESISKNMDEYIGQVIEIDAMQGSGHSFRHPRFKRVRIDKTAYECVWDSNNVKVKVDLI